MGKGEKKRGRPSIKPQVQGLIASRVFEDQAKPPEARMHVKMLAFEIQKEIKQTGDRPPELSTLEKKIQECKRKRSPEDEPWSIGTLDRYPVPPQTFPKVLEEYKRHKDEGISFTIREAKWVARLSVTQCSKTLPYLIARTELLYELIGRKPDFEIFDRLLAGLPGQADNWQVPFMASASLAAVLKDDPIKEYNLRREAQNERKHKTKKQK